MKTEGNGPKAFSGSGLYRLRRPQNGHATSQVYEELVSRGYRVTPQVKTGAYRIDLVVEGSADTRLAVECDGDEFHGPERWQHDTAPPVAAG